MGREVEDDRLVAGAAQRDDDDRVGDLGAVAATTRVVTRNGSPVRSAPLGETPCSCTDSTTISCEPKRFSRRLQPVLVLTRPAAGVRA